MELLLQIHNADFGIAPGAVMMVPSFVLMRHFGWVDTFLPLIIPGAANAFGIFFFR